MSLLHVVCKWEVWLTQYNTIFLRQRNLLKNHELLHLYNSLDIRVSALRAFFYTAIVIGKLIFEVDNHAKLIAKNKFCFKWALNFFMSIQYHVLSREKFVMYSSFRAVVSFIELVVLQSHLHMLLALAQHLTSHCYHIWWVLQLYDDCYLFPAITISYCSQILMRCLGF